MDLPTAARCGSMSLRVIWRPVQQRHEKTFASGTTNIRREHDDQGTATGNATTNTATIITTAPAHRMSVP